MAAGWLVSKGLLESDDTGKAVEIITGIAVGGGAIIWSLMHKKKEADKTERKDLVLGVLAQGLETSREVIKSLPSGGKTEVAFVEKLKEQQTDAGVRADVREIVKSDVVSTPQAKAAAVQVVKEAKAA